MQSLWLIIVVFFLVIFILPLFIKIHLTFDFLNNLGVVSLYVFFIKVIALKIKFQNNEIVLYSEKKQKEIDLTISEGQKRFLKQFTIQLKEKLILRKCTAMSRIGIKDAMTTALLTGVFNSFVGAMFGKIKTLKKSASLNIISQPEFNGRHLLFCIYAHMFITLFDFLYAIVMSFLIVKRSEKYERI